MHVLFNNCYQDKAVVNDRQICFMLSIDYKIGILTDNINWIQLKLHALTLSRGGDDPVRRCPIYIYSRGQCT